MESPSNKVANQISIEKMSLLQRVIRKIYKLFHPAMGEVWMLHRVVEKRSNDSKQKELEVTPYFLEQKILEYKGKGVEFVSIDEVCGRLRQPIFYQYINALFRHTRFVCITLDDGYLDNYETAYPIFKRHNVPFVIYIATGFIEGTTTPWWYGNKENMFMSRSNVIEIAKDPLCTIGAHTVSHPRLSEVSVEIVRNEIYKSKIYLESLLKMPIVHFSYPHGVYNAEIVAVAKSIGMYSSVLVWGGNVRVCQSVFKIARIPITMD